MCIAIRQPTTVGQVTARRAQGRLEPAHEPVVAVGGQFARAFAVDRQFDFAAAPDPDLELDPVGDRQGDAQAVVAGTEVGR